MKSHYLHTERRRLAQKKEEAETTATTPGGIMGLNLIVLDKKDAAPTDTASGEKNEKTKSQPKDDDTPAVKAPKESKELSS